MCNNKIEVEMRWHSLFNKRNVSAAEDAINKIKCIKNVCETDYNKHVECVFQFLFN